MTRKHLSFFCAAALLLSACGTTGLPTVGSKGKTGATRPQAQTRPAPFVLASSHWTDVAKIRAEAQRLGSQVRSGSMTRVQAAQHLNKFRIKQVDRNSIDDSVYDVYLHAAVESQSGKITSDQSRAYVENALRGWQQRWPHMKVRPANPAFTNFLLEYMNMKPLQ